MMDKQNVTDELLSQTDEDYTSVILAEHPEVHALWRRLDMLSDMVDINGVNPVLHILFESIVEKQVREGTPPEAREAVERLQRAGLSPHAARGSVAALFVVHFYNALDRKRSFDEQAYGSNLKLLGTALDKVGRNEPCPCGSGNKFKKCCIEMAKYFTPQEHAGFLLLGQGAYASTGHLLKQATEAPVVQLENRSHIAWYLAKQGDLEGALAALKDNVKLAEGMENRGYLQNALHDVEHLCLNHKELSAEGVLVMDRLLEYAEDDDQKGFCYCNRADFLAATGQVEEAEKEYHSLFSRMPGWHFGRYRYALLLEQLGRREDAVDFLRSLLASDEDIDEETCEAIEDFLAGAEAE